MIDKNDLLVDDYVDDVRNFLHMFKKIPTWTKEKHSMNNEMKELLAEKKYIYFRANKLKYCLGAIGESGLFDVPEKKRGLLKPFRGKRVRLVCVESGGHGSRGYMVGVVERV